MRTLLVANRGEIARRIFRSCRRLDIATVAVYSTVDASSPHVTEADAAVALVGPPEGAYVDVDGMVAAALRAGADAIHPGYGFLAENADFAAAVVAAGLVFVGPPASVITVMGDKLEARRLAAAAGLPVLDGGVGDETAPRFPVLVKAAAGGGGRGMVRVDRAEDLDDALATAQRRAGSLFGDDRVYLEEMVTGARHVEVQVVADRHGGVVHLHDRECSVQRRFQKVVEEAPAPDLDPGLRAELADAACRLARSVGYTGAGTVEFLVGPDGNWWFLEMNTRLQVEHPVTEAVTGSDLVALQLTVADGGRVPAQGDIPTPAGHAVEARLLAEDPVTGAARVGVIRRFEVSEGPGLRVDAGVVTGSVVSADYDPLLAKVIATGDDRPTALAALAVALHRARIHGVATNRDQLVRILRHRDLIAGPVDVGWLERVAEETARPLVDGDARVAPAVAAAIALARERRRSATVMPAVPAGFRNVGQGWAHTSLETGGETIEVSYRLHPHPEAKVGERAFAVVGDGGDVVDLIEDGVRRRFEVTAHPDGVVVDGPGGSVALVELPWWNEPAPERPAGSLAAPVPGRVTVVDAARGATVSPGDRLVVVESMKLEHTVTAVDRGVVEDIVAVGDTVTMGQVVAVVRGTEEG